MHLQMIRKSLVLIVIGASLSLVAAPVRAQQWPSLDQASQDAVDHGFMGLRCESFVTLMRAPNHLITRMTVAWLDGYVVGIGVSLEGAKIASGVQRKTPMSEDEQEVATGIVIGAFSGWPGILERASMATRSSELSDYCQHHREESLQAAIGSLLLKWLKLPKLPAAPK